MEPFGTFWKKAGGFEFKFGIEIEFGLEFKWQKVLIDSYLSNGGVDNFPVSASRTNGELGLANL